MVFHLVVHTKRKSRVENEQKERLRAEFARLLDLKDHDFVTGQASSSALVAEPQGPISIL